MKRAALGYVALAAGLVAAFAYGFAPRPVAVDVAKARVGAMRVTHEEEGRTRVRERYVVTAPVTGYLRRVTWKAGDAVAAGAVLAYIEPTRPAALDDRARAQAAARAAAAEAGWRAAQERVRAAAAEYTLAGQEKARMEQLGAIGFVSQQAVDQARARFELGAAALAAAEASAEAARHEREAVRALLNSVLPSSVPAGETIAVRAPTSGRILRLARESEGAVAAGEPILELGDTEKIEIVAEVLSNVAVNLAPGGKVEIMHWGGEGVLTGRVRLVEPTGYTKVSALGVEEQRVRVVIDLEGPPDKWRGLGDGYRVDVRFILWQGENVLTVPSRALFRHGDDWATFVLDNGRARLRLLRIGRQSGLHAQVLEGLQPGETLIHYPDDRVRDGVRVRPR